MVDKWREQEKLNDGDPLRRLSAAQKMSGSLLTVFGCVCGSQHVIQVRADRGVRGLGREGACREGRWVWVGRTED